MSRERSENVFVSWYRTRIGEPLNADEVYGYWVFVVGAILSVVGVLWFVAYSAGSSGARELGYVLAAGGVVLVIAGGTYRLPLGRPATLATYVGGAIALGAIAWFAAIFPSGWALDDTTTTGIVLAYVAGIAVMLAGAVLAPMFASRRTAETDRERLARKIAESEADVADLERRLEDAHEETARLEDERADAEERAETAAERAETAAERTDATAARAAVAERRLAEIADSNATFEVYRDAAEEWRWRLVHRNRNIIATSGEGYSSDRSARRGMRSVKRNAPGADVVWLPAEEEGEDEPEPTPDPVHDADSVRATVETFEDEGGDYRWRLVHDNGQRLAISARGYASIDTLREGLDRVRERIGPADYLTFDPAGFEVYEDRAGEWRWRLVHRNGNVLADSGEGYATRSGAREAVSNLDEYVPDAPVNPEDDPDPVALDLYEDAAGKWRWRLVHRNGNVLADSGEGYTERNDAAEAIENLREYVPEADTLGVGAASFEVFEDEAGEHRWRLRHRNGTILAITADGYASRSNAIDNVNRVKRNLPNAPIEEA